MASACPVAHTAEIGTNLVPKPTYGNSSWDQDFLWISAQMDCAVRPSAKKPGAG